MSSGLERRVDVHTAVSLQHASAHFTWGNGCGRAVKGESSRAERLVFFDELRAERHGVDAELVNTQALERADRNDQNQTKHTGDRSDRSGAENFAKT